MLCVVARPYLFSGDGPCASSWPRNDCNLIHPDGIAFPERAGMQIHTHTHAIAQNPNPFQAPQITSIKCRHRDRISIPTFLKATRLPSGLFPGFSFGSRPIPTRFPPSTRGKALSRLHHTRPHCHWFPLHRRSIPSRVD